MLCSVFRIDLLLNSYLQRIYILYATIFNSTRKYIPFFAYTLDNFYKICPQFAEDIIKITMVVFLRNTVYLTKVWYVCGRLVST